MALSSSVTFMVANALRDINVLIGQFKQQPDTLLSGADTVGRGLKELAEKNIVYKSETSDQSYRFNTAEKLNTLGIFRIYILQMLPLPRSKPNLSHHIA